MEEGELSDDPEAVAQEPAPGMLRVTPVYLTHLHHSHTPVYVTHLYHSHTPFLSPTSVNVTHRIMSYTSIIYSRTPPS